MGDPTHGHLWSNVPPFPSLCLPRFQSPRHDAPQNPNRPFFTPLDVSFSESAVPHCPSLSPLLLSATLTTAQDRYRRSTAGGFSCDVCGGICYSRISLLSHGRTHMWWDPSRRRLSPHNNLCILSLKTNAVRRLVHFSNEAHISTRVWDPLA